MSENLIPPNAEGKAYSSQSTGLPHDMMSEVICEAGSMPKTLKTFAGEIIKRLRHGAGLHGKDNRGLIN
jgi:hypothetical protein